MSNPIADYALIGDMRTTALVSREGSIDWLCGPRHDSPAVFLRLIDDEKGGFSEVDVGGRISTERRYLPATNIVETTILAEAGRAVLLDLMPVNSPETVPKEGPDGEAESRIIRLISCVTGRIEGSFRTKPTFDYARLTPEVSHDEGGLLFRKGGQDCLVSSNVTVSLENGNTAVARFSLREGEQVYLVLGHRMEGDPPPEDIAGIPEVLQRVDRTRRYWEAWSGRCTYDGPYQDAVLRSVLCLKLMTYAPSGAIIAAPTMGLPEAVPGNRNYDYRFSWLRDASFTVTSFINLGYLREATEYLRFLAGADETRGRDLRLMYGIAGDVLPEEALPHLTGWRGVGPIGIGNAAASQTQHDIYGEFLIALHAWLEAADFEENAPLARRLPELVANLAANALARRGEPDHGIWELRSGLQQNLHTKALIVVALNRAAVIAERIGGVDADTIALWKRAARETRDEYLARAWSEEHQAYMQSYGSDVLDAAVMRVALFGGVEPSSPRMKATIAAIERDLSAGDLVYRYRMDDGLEGHEATFTACAFWRVGCLALGGEASKAASIFERLLGMSNDVGLYAEEIDASSGEQRGNFPQAFTHMAVINHAIRLQAALRREAERSGNA